MQKLRLKDYRERMFNNTKAKNITDYFAWA